MRMQSFKTQKSPVRVDRSDLDEEGQLLEGSHSVLNPDNVSVEDVFDRFASGGRLLSTDTVRAGRDPLQTLVRRENRRLRSN